MRIVVTILCCLCMVLEIAYAVQDETDECSVILAPYHVRYGGLLIPSKDYAALPGEDGRVNYGDLQPAFFALVLSNQSTHPITLRDPLYDVIGRSSIYFELKDDHGLRRVYKKGQLLHEENVKAFMQGKERGFVMTITLDSSRSIVVPICLGQFDWKGISPPYDTNATKRLMIRAVFVAYPSFPKENIRSWASEYVDFSYLFPIRPDSKDSTAGLGVKSDVHVAEDGILGKTQGAN